MEKKIIVPGFYSDISDYNLLTLNDTAKVSKDAVVFLADLPDFVFLPDAESTNPDAVRKVRVAPNTILPITNVEEALRVLTGENLLDGILTDAEKEELVCKDIINILTMAQEEAIAGQVAVVKIVKNDGTRPDMSNKYEAYQALENTYNKLGNVNVSQIVPTGISAEEAFEVAESYGTIEFGKSEDAWVSENIAKTLFKDIYTFAPSTDYPKTGLEFTLSQPVATFDAAEGGTPSPEAQIIIDKGLDSVEKTVTDLLTGEVAIAGTNVASKLQLELGTAEFSEGETREALVLKEDVRIEIVEGEIAIVIAKGHPFAFINTKDHKTTGKKIVAPVEADGAPAINPYNKDGKVAPGINQNATMEVIKTDLPWVQVINLGDREEQVTSVRVLEGSKDGVPNYNPLKSGSAEVSFKVNTVAKKAKVIINEEEVIEVPVTINGEGLATIKEKLEIEVEMGVTIVIDAGTVVKRGVVVVSNVAPKGKTATSRRTVDKVYFDVAVDAITEPKYVINFVPVNAEPIMKSLEYAQKLTQELSETLVVWGCKPPISTEPEHLIKYAENLVNLPKFKKGFTKRLSASKKVDLGMFLSVVVGGQKYRGIGGLTNFPQTKAIDFERSAGGNGPIMLKTDKVFVADEYMFIKGNVVEMKTYKGIKLVSEQFKVLSVTDVLGKRMLTLDKKVDTTIFNLDKFEVIVSKIDAKDTLGSYIAASFALAANTMKDRAPVAYELKGTSEIKFPSGAIKTLLSNKFTVISTDPVSGNGTVVDCPLMTESDSDFQERSQMGCVLYFLKKLRALSVTKKGKRFPAKEDKVLFEDELRGIFKTEIGLKDAVISNFEFKADMSRLDSHGYLAAKFRVKDTKKFKTASFSGGLAKM